ncbi:hypothetical protein SAMN05421829_111131 [Aromatoleum tolulyticum]|uniref:Porin domain-containing protein n=1 Tax=Aromatoleum tolulyticum TaxID=34027 RepID=A0A1N6Z7J8_9RHOO|nr:porin [Aromatoleum tolulyticum]SIR22746.1 hypothetical protein SAMN05421829_111131 [Aromatoleum tolulyticum]
MVVDDAGTLDKGGAKLEFGWMRDDQSRGFDAAAGYGPIDNLEVEIAYARARDHEPHPSLWAHGVGGAVKWVPLQAETGLSAGLKAEYARERVDLREGESDEIARASSVTGLATWAFVSGGRVHLNLGREWVRAAGDTHTANTWGLGFEHPLTDDLTIAAEVFGAEDGRPDRQVGLRYEIVEGVQVSGAVGRGSDRTIANVGVAWEF